MKSKIQLILSALALSASLQAQEYNTYDCDKQQWCCEIETEENSQDDYLQVRGAAFLPFNNDLRKVYGSSLPTLQVEGAITISNNLLICDDSVLLWGNISWAQEKGRSREWGNPTRISLIPYSFGLEYQFNLIQDLDFYLGIGPSYSVMRIKNSDCFETRHCKRYHWGVTTKTGIRYAAWKNVFVDVFADYYYTQFRNMRSHSSERINNNIGGFFVGGGLGIKW